MTTINLQCNSPSQIRTFKCLVQTDNSMTDRAYIRRRSADTNLAEICEEMSELLDKQVNV